MSVKSGNLIRKIGLFSASNIVIANMIGAGIFTTSGLLMSGLNDPWLLLVLWIAGGIIALCGALSYAELGAAMPFAGGEYVFLSRLYHPMLGFLSGWISFIVGFSAPIAASAIGFGEYFLRAFPAGPEFPFHSVNLSKGLAIVVIVLFTFIHMRGLVFGTRIQNYLTLMKVVLIVVLIAMGLLFGKGDIHHFSIREPMAFNFNSLKTFGLSLMWIMFAYSGWNASTYIGSEIKDPVRNLPRSLLFGTGVVTIMYVLLNIVFVYATPPNEIKGVISIGGLTARNLFGPSIDAAFSLLIAFALFSSLSAFIIIGPRVYYSMAHDGYFFSFAAKVHPVYQTPWVAILLQSGIAILMVLTSSFDQILTYMGFALGIFPLLAVAGVFKLRASGKNVLRFPRLSLHLIIYLIFGTMMLTLSYFERPIESSIALATVLAGIPVYYYFNALTRSQPRDPSF